MFCVLTRTGSEFGIWLKKLFKNVDLPKLQQAENGHRVRTVKQRAEAQGRADLALIRKAGVPLISSSAAPNFSNLGPKCVLEAAVLVGERSNLMCQ